MTKTHARSKARGGGTSPSTMRSFLDELEGRGFRSQFRPQKEGHIRCGSCSADFPAREADVREMRRVDVNTDPGDQALLVALACPRCRAQGTLMLSYGPAASRIDADVLGQLQRRNRREAPR